MAKRLRIMGVHGLGDHRNSTWQADWERAIRDVFPGRGSFDLEFSFVTYDPLFERVDLSAWQAAKAIWKLARSAVTSAFQRDKGVVGQISDRMRWTAGYVVAWVEDEDFKAKTRKLLYDAFVEHRPDVLLAHSLGSLITYDACTHADVSAAKVAHVLQSMRYVTLGSQIGNAFVTRNLTPGRIVMPPVKSWYHLYNAEDDVFTAPIRIWDAENFRQVDTRFDDEGIGDHTAMRYLTHDAAVMDLWSPIANEFLAPRVRAIVPRVERRRRARVARDRDRPRRRALLVGINEYPNKEDRLEGSVNDVFLMSAALQECGFSPDEIRVCLDERATADGILKRLEWLLDEPRPGDERVFFYSGHGAQIPEYGECNEPDRVSETLVPYDFDWSPDTAIVDERIFRLYSQLPFETRFAMILDCCHSGGVHRAGGSKPRGLNPPDDIRHRALRWDSREQMWVERDLGALNKEFTDEPEDAAQYFGKSGSTVRLGRASMLRGESLSKYRSRKRSARTSAFGPYLPLIIQACAEDELAYEYRHGVTSYGAFTYSLTANLRRRGRVSFKELVRETRNQLGRLGYEQTPQLLAPAKIAEAPVPWTSAARPAGRKRRARKPAAAVTAP
jgi:metacaspase-1